MNTPLLRRPGEGGKPPSLRQEALEQAWDAFVKARGRAMTSAKVEDGLKAGRRWGEFLRLFEKA